MQYHRINCLDDIAKQDRFFANALSVREITIDAGIARVLAFMRIRIVRRVDLPSKTTLKVTYMFRTEPSACVDKIRKIKYVSRTPGVRWNTDHLFLACHAHSTVAMDFLKSAVASAISKDPPFPYKFGDRLTVNQSIWSLHNGTKRVCVLLTCHHETMLNMLFVAG